MNQVRKSILKELFPLREKGKYFRKYDFGLVLIIGGGQFYSGSPALSAMAACQTGVDMTRIISPRRAADIIAGFSPEMATYPLEGDYLNKTHLPFSLAQTESAKTVSRGNVAVIIGGGAGRSEETKETILEYLSQIDVPAVLDAAAIHAAGENPEVIRGKPFLLTPHTYEFFVLTKEEVYQLDPGKQEKLVKEQAAKLGTTILLKTMPDIISDGKETVYNKGGSPYMSVGGTGDALAGICGALMARGVSPFLAGQAGSLIIGMAGEKAGEKLKEGLLATEVIKEIAGVLH